MQADYKPFVDRMIGRYEGPYGWNRQDPGGPTKYGITCFDLAEHRGQKMTSMTTWAPLVAQMSLSEAEDIYQTKYARYVRFDDLPAGVDCEMLDYGVNSGRGRPCIVARTLLKLSATSQPVDDALLDAIHKTDPKWLIDQLSAERLRFMHAIRGGSAWVEFGRGWQARVDDLRTYSERLAAGSTHETAPPPPDLSKVATPKAAHAPSTAGGKTAGGVVVAAGAAHAAGAPLWGVALAAGAVLVAGLAYELWQEHRAAAANQLVHV